MLRFPKILCFFCFDKNKTHLLINNKTSLEICSFSSLLHNNTTHIIMKITIKPLKGSECCLEVDSTTTILEIKQEIEKKLNISVGSQRLLYLGKTLADEQAVSFYPAIKEGTKLNLAVKKPEGLYDVSLKEYKKMGFSDSEAATAANRLLTTVKEKLNLLSWDDLDRLSNDFLMVKDGERPLRVEPDNTDDPSGM